MRPFCKQMGNLALGLARSILRGHHYSFLIKAWLHCTLDSSSGILESPESMVPMFIPSLGNPYRKWFPPGAHCHGVPPASPLLSFRLGFSMLHGGENYSHQAMSRSSWACQLKCDPELFCKMSVVIVSPAVPIRIINIINNKGFNYGCLMRGIYNYHPNLI